MHERRGLPRAVALVLVIAALPACVAGPDTNPQQQSAPSDLQPTAQTSELNAEADAPTPSPETLTLQGWLSIVWNDEPHFFLTQDDGQTVEVLLDEQLTQPLGGPLALDRTRVIVLAVAAPEAPDVFEALSIEIEAGG
jgi:hypothetical protein